MQRCAGTQAPCLGVQSLSHIHASAFMIPGRMYLLFQSAAQLRRNDTATKLNDTEQQCKLQAERAREAEQTACAAAEEAEALRRLCSQLPRPIMSARTEISITLSLARLMKSSGEDKVILPHFSHCQMPACRTMHCVWHHAPSMKWTSIRAEVGDGTTAAGMLLLPNILLGSACTCWLLHGG